MFVDGSSLHTQCSDFPPTVNSLNARGTTKISRLSFGIVAAFKGISVASLPTGVIPPSIAAPETTAQVEPTALPQPEPPLLDQVVEQTGAATEAEAGAEAGAAGASSPTWPAQLKGWNSWSGAKCLEVMAEMLKGDATASQLADCCSAISLPKGQPSFIEAGGEASSRTPGDIWLIDVDNVSNGRKELNVEEYWVQIKDANGDGTFEVIDLTQSQGPGWVENGVSFNRFVGLLDLD